METDKGAKLGSALSEFKIDLIVWKRGLSFALQSSSAGFKIDLIVWKQKGDE